MSPHCDGQYATGTDQEQKGPEMTFTPKAEKSRGSRTFLDSGSDGTRTRDLRRDRTDEKTPGGAEVVQTQARRCELHFANRGPFRADVRNQYVWSSNRLLDQRARELCHLMRGHDVWDDLDEICQQRYRHLIRRMDRLPA